MIIIDLSTLDRLLGNALDELRKRCDCHAHVAGVVVRLTHNEEVDDLVIEAVTSNLMEQLGESCKRYGSKEAAIEGAVVWIDGQIELLKARRAVLV